MAPAIHNKSTMKVAVAPSSNSRSTIKTSAVRKSQSSKLPQSSTLKTSFGRVTKSRLDAHVPGSKGDRLIKAKLDLIADLANRENEEEERKPERCVEVVVPVQEQSEKSEHSAKRKRRQSYSSDDDNDEQKSTRDNELNIGKKRKFHNRNLLQIQLPSPPASRKGSSEYGEEDEAEEREEYDTISPKTIVRKQRSVADLPQSLADLVAMHSAFLKAISVHFAHNGASTPAETNAILESTTRLWKKQTVRKQDLQKMFGLYEIAADPSRFPAKQVEQRNSPFKMVTSGLGLNVITNVEYVGQNTYDEKALQISYSNMVRKVFTDNQMIASATLPLLTIALGTQTSLRRAKVAETRAEILNLSAAAQARSTPDFSKLSINDASEQAPASVKSRTLSLFDRVRAKALANAGNVAPTPEQMLRRHAIGRISEVVDFLRMKQQQRLSADLYGSTHDSFEKTKVLGKVSFSLHAIVQDIRQSVGVPIGEAEVKVCLQVLSQEVPGDWCRMIEIGTVTSVTLQGNGMSGTDVKKQLEQTGRKF